MKNGIIMIEDKEIPVEYNEKEFDLSVKYETITIGGESDEEFQTRRNTFLRWAIGLPKKRKEVTDILHGAIRTIGELHFKVPKEFLEYFELWMGQIQYAETAFAYKRDFIIEMEDKEKIRVYGAYCSMYTIEKDITDPNIEIVYDYKEKIKEKVK